MDGPVVNTLLWNCETTTTFMLEWEKQFQTKKKQPLSILFTFQWKCLIGHQKCAIAPDSCVHTGLIKSLALGVDGCRQVLLSLILQPGEASEKPALKIFLLQMLFLQWYHFLNCSALSQAAINIQKTWHWIELCKNGYITCFGKAKKVTKRCWAFLNYKKFMICGRSK